jgi:hypothetical protein
MSGAVSAVGDLFHNVGQMFSTPKQPTLQAPNALSQTPTQAQASATASQQTLQSEQQAASTSTILSGGGAGLLDQPTTTSRTLLGS